MEVSRYLVLNPRDEFDSKINKYTQLYYSTQTTGQKKIQFTFSRVLVLKCIILKLVFFFIKKF